MSTAFSKPSSRRNPLLISAAAAALLTPMMVPAIAHANPAPDAESTTITNTGEYQQVVPDGVCSVNVTIAGAPGGNAIAPVTGGVNGAGAVLQADLAVGAGQTLSGFVGSAGQEVRTGGTPGGGLGGGQTGHPGAGGGGYSSLSIGSDLLLLAGGGGGTGGGHDPLLGTGGDAGFAAGLSVTGGTLFEGSAGGSGMDLGQNSSPATHPNGGGGGSDVGGSGGTNPRSALGGFNWDALPGGALVGGTGGDDNSFDGGGGGGAGYFGGGGGAGTSGQNGEAALAFQGGGGGGGSSFVSDDIDPTTLSAFRNVDTNGSTLAGYASFVWTMCDYDLSVTKTALGTGVFEDGDTVSYEITVTNEGADAMGIGDTVSVIDDLAVGGTLTGVSGLNVSVPAVGETITNVGIELYNLVGDAGAERQRGLAVGESVTLTYDVVITGTEAVENTVSVTDRGNADNNSASVTVVPAEPSLELLKSSDTEAITAAGQQINYSFLVTNTGNIAMSDIEVVEGDFSGTGDLAPAVCPEVTLAPEDSMVCEAVYTATQADVDAGTITNTAVASGLTPAGNLAISEESSAEVNVLQSPSLDLIKSSNADNATRAGQTIDYVFTLTNTGNVTLTDLAVQEGHFSGTGAMSAIDCPAEPLAPGKAAECTASYKVTAADMETKSLTNTAAATASDPNGDSVKSASSTVVIPVTKLVVTGASNGLVLGAVALTLIIAGGLTLTMRRRSVQG